MCGKKKSFLVYFVFKLLLLKDISGINSPTYTSEWRNLTAQTGAFGSETVFFYNFNELPVKVDVQVKVTENDIDYIFTGFGSAHRDDDTDIFYGGVLYTYNEEFARILLPSFNGGYPGAAYTTKGTAAFTGKAGYTGSTRILGQYSTVDVRIRVWLMCDFGDPIFQYEWVDLDDNLYYKEVAHNLGTYPDLLTVQTLCGGTELPMYSDAQAAICNYYDGWGSNTHSYSGSGRVRILAWIFPFATMVFKKTLTMTQYQNNTYEVDLLEQYNIRDFLVTVDVTVDDGINDGFRFAAAGNSQTDGTRGQYGGIIYVYSNETVLLWRPSDLFDGKIVFIGGIWGGGINQQASTTGEVLIRIYNTSGAENTTNTATMTTTYLEANTKTMATASTKMSLTSSSRAAYATSTKVQQTYTSDASNRTSTLVPLDCSDPTPVANAMTLHNGTSNGCVALYSCIAGYSMVSGDIEHVCQYGSWQGKVPVCSVCTSSYLTSSIPSSSEKNQQSTYHIHKIHYKTTTMYKKTLGCAYDPRLSAVYIGSGGIFILCLQQQGSQLIIPHDLGEYPVKVDVQIRVIDNGDYYIFTGSGSAHRDDDSATDYGGVVYIYNTADIRVYAPDGEGSIYAATTGLVAFTGGTGRTGSTLIGGSYTSGEVKVRAWKLCDIGPPTFYHQWTAISSSSAYHEIPHNLGVYPDLVTVQIALDSTDYWSDAQGSAGISDPVSILNSGGVLFGYDTTRIRLWASSDGFVFSAYDGWGENDDWRYSSGQIRIICWTFSPSEILFEHTLTMGIALTSSYEIPFSANFETDDILVSTEITVSDGNNPGFRFYGTGNSLTDGSFIPFGGVVYVYTETQILLWRPSDSSGGKMVYHNSIWANGYMNQMSDTAQVTIRIMTASGAVAGACGHGSCIATMDPVSVSCTCEPNWTGSDCKTNVPTTTIPPTTTTMPPTTTTTPPTTTTTPPTTTIPPTTTTTQRTTTTTQRTTIPNPTTTTASATTTVMTTLAAVTSSVCGSPSTIANTNSLYDGTSQGSKVMYSCDSGYTMSSGDQIHTCSAGVWVGTPPVCLACPNTYTPVITTPEELNDRLDVLKKNTEVHVKNTTSYKRSLVCANDPRPSSLYVATVGIVILGLVGIFPLLADGINLYEHCHSSNNDSCDDDGDSQDENNKEENDQQPQTRFGNFFRQNINSPPRRPVYHN
ncbi:uncharacterized protein LOC117328368 [Pecten maximus]|uniref:uncharacterized protein LOC117328368 n=1 Tax=Pecten maximus TaxID=6579 RepID=UPI0014589EAE|nr:uncharacterized protein LOC117328368 [Pecten maximus]